MTVGELIEQLRRFPAEARVVGSSGGFQVVQLHVGVGTTGCEKEPCVVIADRRAFAGQLPDVILAR